jgi:adenosylcobinamide kinase/adenosylcobinamide-phosphate guanylyltransferase
MADRIAKHRERRGDHWRTVEEPIGLAARLLRESRPDQPILVDCLTLWLGNLMGGERDVTQACDALLRILPGLNGPVVMVSNEVGWGIVPDNALARRFRDHAGELHQRIAAIADSVVLVAAGLPLILK